MALAMTDLEKKFQRIIAFVGDAHVEGMKRILEKNDVPCTILHLHSLLGNQVTKRTDSVNFSIN